MDAVSHRAAREIRFSSARVEITPPFPVPLAGYSDRTGSYAQTDTPLEAGAIGFFGNDGPSVLVSLDLLYAGPAVRENLLAHFRGELESKDLLLCATHTHGAPAVDPTKPLLGKIDPRYLEWVTDRLRRLVRECLERDPKAGTVHYAERLADHSVNRRRFVERPILIGRRLRRGQTVLAPDPAGERDEKLRVLVLRDQSGRIDTVLWEYACHPVNYPKDRGISPDYPGGVRQKLRATYGDRLNVLFLQGFSGDIRPYYRSQKQSPIGIKQRARALIKGPRFEQSTEEERALWTETLSGRVRDAVETAAQAPALDCAVETRRKEIPLEQLLESAGGDRAFSISRFDFGRRVRLVGLSAEAVVHYRTVVEQLSPGRSIIPVGCTDDSYGYLPTEEMIRSGGYEAGGFLKYFSLPGPFVSGFETTVTDGIREALSGGADGQPPPV